MKIYLSAKAHRQLKKIPRKMHFHLLSHIENLAQEPLPANSKKLRNRNGYRIRVSDHRILYIFNKRRKEITILSVAHRRDAYRH